MINNEIHLISTLLKPQEEAPAVLNKLMTALTKYAPKTQTYHLFQSDALESICFKFFARLSITEAGKKAVHEDGQKILQILLSARKLPEEQIYYMGQSKRLRGIIIKEQAYDGILRIKPIVACFRTYFVQALADLVTQTKWMESLFN